jgi:hypothetical protein
MDTAASLKQVITGLGPFKHQDFVFFVAFVVRIYCCLVEDFFYHKEHKERQGVRVRIIHVLISKPKAG